MEFTNTNIKIMIVVSIIVAVICSTFVYVAFKHTYTHEKRDLKITKRMLSNKIAKKIKNKKK
jgi:hypothetical protein